MMVCVKLVDFDLGEGAGMGSCRIHLYTPNLTQELVEGRSFEGLIILILNQAFSLLVGVYRTPLGLSGGLWGDHHQTSSSPSPIVSQIHDFYACLHIILHNGLGTMGKLEMTNQVDFPLWIPPPGSFTLFPLSFLLFLDSVCALRVLFSMIVCSSVEVNETLLFITTQ